MTRVAGLPQPFARADDDETKTVARGLEAHFLRQMLAEVRQSSSSSMDSGFAGSTFQEMLDGALADSMAKAGGIGLAKIVEKELDKSPPKGAPRSAPAPLDGASPAPHALLPKSAALPVAPVDGAITSRFGARIDPLQGDARVHAGLDLRAGIGTPARAAQSGTVVRAEAAGGYGNLVEVDHGHGLTSRYAHLSRIAVQPGDHVDAGQAVGEVGATGRTTGPHLHFEVRQDGHAVDPTRPLKFSR